MTTTLLHSGKTEHFRALGETGQPVYHSALQLRKVISRRLPGKERHLAIPQRDQQGEEVYWYSAIAGDVIAWSNATEAEREDARIQLEAFRQEVSALSQFPAEGQSGDHEVFTRLVKWVCHIPDDNFVYLVDGIPVLTFWGFIQPEADRHANPLLCLYPSAAPRTIQPAPPPVDSVAPAPTPEPEPAPQPVPVAPARPWWRRWWWLLPLALALGLILFGLRACSSPGAPRLSAPSFESSVPDASFPRSLWQDWDFWPFSGRDVGRLPIPSSGAPALTAQGPDGAPSLPALGGGSAMGTPELPTSAQAMPDAPPPDTGLQALPDGQPSPGVLPDASALPEGVMPAELPMSGMPALPPDTSPTAPGTAPPSLEPLTLPTNAPDGTADFLNGNWRGAGVMDSQTGRPLQVSYAFEQGEGVMYIQRGGSAGMTCAGPVSAAMQGGQLQVEAQQRARCEDGSQYEMPRVQCHQVEGGTASCAASYDDEPFPMQLRKAS